MHGLFVTHGVIQQSQATAAAQKDSTRASHAAQRAEMRVKALEANLAKALMISEALWELLAEKANLTEEDLFKKLYEVDMRDGVLDGKNQKSVSECPACKRPVSGRHAACLYCGEVIDKSVFSLD